jgi:hypothetical protein
MAVLSDGLRATRGLLCAKLCASIARVKRSAPEYIPIRALKLRSPHIFIAFACAGHLQFL